MWILRSEYPAPAYAVSGLTRLNTSRFGIGHLRLLDISRLESTEAKVDECYSSHKWDQGNIAPTDTSILLPIVFSKYKKIIENQLIAGVGNRKEEVKSEEREIGSKKLEVGKIIWNIFQLSFRDRTLIKEKSNPSHFVWSNIYNSR